MKLVEVYNFGEDYPNEKFINPLPDLSPLDAWRMTQIFNSYAKLNSSHYCKAVENDYKLMPAFEP